MPDRSRLLPLALMVAVGALYLATLSNHFSPDGMAFAVLATRDDLANPLFFQAEHLAYPFLGWLWYDLWRLLGYQDGALRALQSLNALAGAAGVAFFFMTARLALAGWRRKTWAALGGSLALALANGYWFHATEGEDQMLANALLAIAAYALVRLSSAPTLHPWAKGERRKAREEKGGKGQVAALFPSCATFALRLFPFSPFSLFVMAWAGAVLAHATHVLFAPAVVVGLRYAGFGWRKTIALVAAAGLVGIGPYLLIGGLVHRLGTPAAFLGWALSAPGHGVWGQVGPRNLWQGAQTLAGALFALGDGPSLRALASREVSAGNLLALGLVVFVLLGLALLAAHWLTGFLRWPFVWLETTARQVARDRALGATCWLWLGVYLVFDLYWAPEDVQFWIALLPPVLLIGLLTIRHLEEGLGVPAHLLAAAGLAGLVLIGAINYRTTMGPRHDLASNRDYVRATCLAGLTRSADLVLAPGWDWTTTYLPYFGQRRVLSLVDTYLLTARRDQTTLFETLRGELSGAWASGHRVYAVRLFALDANDRAWLQRITGTTPGDYESLGQRTVAGECSGEPVWEIRSGG